MEEKRLKVIQNMEEKKDKKKSLLPSLKYVIILETSFQYSFDSGKIKYINIRSPWLSGQVGKISGSSGFACWCRALYRANTKVVGSIPTPVNCSLILYTSTCTYSFIWVACVPSDGPSFHLYLFNFRVTIRQ